MSTGQNKKPTIYIAGPMSGKPGYNMAAFDAAAERLSTYGWDVINPAEVSRVYCDKHGITLDQLADTPAYLDDLMRRELHMVIDADAIYLLDKWQYSEGAYHECSVFLHSHKKPDDSRYEEGDGFFDEANPARQNGKRQRRMTR